MKKLLVFLKKYKKELIGAFLCLMAEDVLELSIPFLMADIIDVGVAQHDRIYILRCGGMMVLFALMAFLLGTTYARLIARGGQGFGAELRRAEYEKIQSFSFANSDRFTHSGLLTRLTSDVNQVQNALTSGLRPLIRGTLNIPLTLTFSFILNRKLAAVFFIALPLLAAGTVFLLSRVHPRFRRMQATLERLNMVIEENLTAIRIVKAYVREDYEGAKFAAAAAEQRHAAFDATATSVLNAPMIQFAMYVSICVILWNGGNLYISDAVSVGDLTGILSYTRQVLNSLTMLSNVFMLINRSTASISRILEVLDEKVDINDEQALSEAEITRGEIEFRHVCFKYDPNAAEDTLADITLHIPAGQTVGIIGGTGSGKSTLIHLIPRLYDIRSGELLIDGMPIRQIPLKHLRDAAAVVLQKNTLFSGTIADNLRWGNPDAAEEQMHAACRDAAIDDFIGTLPEGFNTTLGAKGTGLSGGQCQRLCIARALLKHPKILIMDDSTSAVDIATEAVIRKNIAANYPGLTRIIIAQRISSVMHADLIAVMDDGRIDAIGTHAELLETNRIYREIYSSQLEGALL